ncbi:MAG: hypothetical protein V2I67_19505 [Thermoanaerobaculales bacterium]|jgi:hypothetical protein|nr:hypothetical protein [Thermoanaerobaculales bacterium]
MKMLRLIVVILAVAGAAEAVERDRSWENPIYGTVEEAVEAARELAVQLDTASPRDQQFFVDLTLAEGDFDHAHPSQAVRRTVVDDLLITHPKVFLENPVQRMTIERFVEAVPRQQQVLRTRLAGFGFPELEGLAYLRLVESVDAFSGIGAASSDRMSQVGGVTYYCRYMLLPLSYVSTAAINELNRNPGADVAGSIRSWQAESFANLVNTFRHEMVHVHVNSALKPPSYSDRTATPSWFHEGTATYLAADPHAGLSELYKQYQNLFFFLVQRYGVADLQSFYREVLGGRPVSAALDSVYGISGRSELFQRSARWHRIGDRAKTVFWIAAIVIVLAAFRGSDRPTIGYLLVLAAAALGMATATGLAEHLYGLRGATVVLAAKLGFALVAAVLAVLGIRRVRRHVRAASA